MKTKFSFNKIGSFDEDCLSYNVIFVVCTPNYESEFLGSAKLFWLLGPINNLTGKYLCELCFWCLMSCNAKVSRETLLHLAEDALANAF